MTTYKSVVHLAGVSGLPRDDVINTLWFEHTGDATGTQLDNLGDDISNFYLTAAPTSAEALKLYMASDRDYGVGACRVSFYKMPAVPGPTGPPVRIRTFQMGSPGSTQPLPDQVAVVLSFHSDLSTETVPARRRGRIYFGPLNTTALNEAAGVGAQQTVKSDLQADLTKAALKWFQVEGAADGFTWSVFSQTDWISRPVAGGFVDNRFDTQRRRLERADSRVTFVV